MTLRSSDLQSDSDLDSVRNSCDVFLKTLLFTAFLVTVLKKLAYALVSTWSLVSSRWEHVKRKMHPWIHEHSAWFDSDFSLKTLYLQTIQSIWTAFLYDSAQIKNVICYKTWLSCNLSWWVAVPRTLIASQKSAMHQLIEENVSGPTTFLDVWDILDNCAWRIANGTVY